MFRRELGDVLIFDEQQQCVFSVRDSTVENGGIGFFIHYIHGSKLRAYPSYVREANADCSICYGRSLITFGSNDNAKTFCPVCADPEHAVDNLVFMANHKSLKDGATAKFRPNTRQQRLTVEIDERRIGKQPKPTELFISYSSQYCV